MGLTEVEKLDTANFLKGEIASLAKNEFMDLTIEEIVEYIHTKFYWTLKECDLPRSWLERTTAIERHKYQLITKEN